jgi:hypothetical protein
MKLLYIRLIADFTVGAVKYGHGMPCPWVVVL